MRSRLDIKVHFCRLQRIAEVVSVEMAPMDGVRKQIDKVRASVKVYAAIAFSKRSARSRLVSGMGNPFL
jgi:hypothetical protein